ncbi:MAG TPA: hypothetical protein VFA65_16110 [Bryobacteraceae bacterium]|nr:hypothetical protein [Bryobacteraceae bacterium]
MATYISSNQNRFYTAVETSYGEAAQIAAANRYPAVRLQAQQSLERGHRRDKTGSRTFLGTSSSARRRSAFSTQTYLTSWSGLGQPGYGPLVQAAMGAAAQVSSGLIVAEAQSGTSLQTTAPHGLSMGSGVSYNNEIRFVTSVPAANSLVLNAPFSTIPAANAALAPTASYATSTVLPSVTLYDYWDPVAAVSRIITGAAVEVFGVSVNGDFHEMQFAGPACNLIDSSSFQSGTAGLSAFPAEPALSSFDYTVVPGNLGQVWLGTAPFQFFTLTEATIAIKNNIDLRSLEFGSSYPLAMTPGPRQVSSTFTILAQDDAQTSSLYAAAKERTIITAMLQLGQQQGQLMGIYLASVVPEIPAYDDTSTRLQWQFKNNLAQGTNDDEIYVAFA